MNCVTLYMLPRFSELLEMTKILFMSHKIPIQSDLFVEIVGKQDFKEQEENMVEGQKR
jgi:hypothetical protein